MFRRPSIILFFVLAGCAQFSLVEPTQRVTVAKVYSVSPSTTWSGFTTQNWVRWTVDGPLLQALTFIEPVETGRPLLDISEPKNLPLFNADMTAPEVMELFKATMQQMGLHQLAARGLEPAEFGKISGFRFDFTAVSKDGLNYSGFAAGAVQSDKLHLVFYTGSQLVYFEKHREDARKVIQSIQLQKT